MNETNERFLKAVLERLPAERVVEIHLFPAIRQGLMETGIAVIAAEAAVALGAPGPLALHANRLEVYTALYRWTRKGADRGKWEVELKAEADAPLITVEAVVRGVQERLGDGIEPERISSADLRALISEPAWQSTP